MHTTTVQGLVALMALATTAFGQDEGDQPRDGDRPEREGQQERQRSSRDGDRPGPRDGERPGPFGFGPPPVVVMLALDEDRDGQLSADEVEQAVAALKKLDRNEDGVIDREELRPDGPFGRSRGPRPDGDRPEGNRPPREGDRPPREGDREADRGPREEGESGPRPDGDRAPRGEGDRGPRPDGDRGPRPDGDRGFRGGEDRGRRGRGFGAPGSPGGGPERLIDRLMESDEDGDGKLSREELLRGFVKMHSSNGPGGRGDREGDSGRPQRPE